MRYVTVAPRRSVKKHVGPAIAGMEGGIMIKRDFFARGRGKAAAGLLLTVIPIAATFAMRRRSESRSDEPEPTELDYQPAEGAFPFPSSHSRTA